MATSSSDVALNTCAVKSLANVHVVSLKYDKQIKEISGSIILILLTPIAVNNIQVLPDVQCNIITITSVNKLKCCTAAHILNYTHIPVLAMGNISFISYFKISI